MDTNLSVKKVDVQEGIGMKDKATGEKYCVEIVNGEFVKTKGACGVENIGDSQSASVIDSLPPSTDTSTTTPETGGTGTSTPSTGDTGTSTPPVDPTPAPEQSATSSDPVAEETPVVEPTPDPVPPIVEPVPDPVPPVDPVPEPAPTE